MKKTNDLSANLRATFNSNSLGLIEFTKCKVIRESDSHFFCEMDEIIFTGWSLIDKKNLHDQEIFEFLGRVDGFLLKQYLNMTEFIIVSRSINFKYN